MHPSPLPRGYVETSFSVPRYAKASFNVPGGTLKLEIILSQDTIYSFRLPKWNILSAYRWYVETIRSLSGGGTLKLVSCHKCEELHGIGMPELNSKYFSRTCDGFRSVEDLNLT